MGNPAPNVQSVGAVATGTFLATVEVGSVEAAELLVKRGFQPALLNFAHGYNCGGGFEHAGGSQEEDIFRKTSLFLSIWPHRCSDDGPGVRKRWMWIGDYDKDLPRKEPFYPHAECGGIYSPYVGVVRKRNEATTCENLTTFSVITAAAQHVGREGPFKPKLLLEKARTVLWMAASQGHDSVVLGAFGCGCFSNPPNVVAETFRKLLSSGGEFENIFRMVVFGITGGPGNIRPFAERFPMLKAEALPSSDRLLLMRIGANANKADAQGMDAECTGDPGVSMSGLISEDEDADVELLYQTITGQETDAERDVVYKELDTEDRNSFPV